MSDGTSWAANLEAELKGEELATLGNVMAHLDRPLHTWARVPWIRQLVEYLAVENRAASLQGDGPRAPAVERACRELGIPLDTHLRRMYRAQEYTFDPERCPERY